MRSMILIGFAMLSGINANAQLRADAGPDTAWCSPGYAGTTPRLGGAMPASGGTPPYTYTWEAIGISGGAYYLLDTFTIAHPKVTGASSSSGPDSVLFRLHVADASGAAADDTVRVYFSYLFCPIGDYPIPKRVGDTVRLKPGFNCYGRFEPLRFSHWNTSMYLADSTDLYTKCWCPENYFRYGATYIDRIGCPVPGWVNIYIYPDAVPNGPAQDAGIAVVPNPVTMQSELRCGAAWIGGTLILTTIEGREVGRYKILSERTPLFPVLPKAGGVYPYRIVSPAGKVFTGKLVRQ